MTKIYIVTFGESSECFADPDIGNDRYHIIKVFKSLDTAKNYVKELCEARVKELKEENEIIEYQGINDGGASIFWSSPEAQNYGVTDYVIHEHELAE